MGSTKHGITLRAGFLLVIFMLVAITSRPQEPAVKSGPVSSSHHVMIGKKSDYFYRDVIREDSLHFASGIFSWYQSASAPVWNIRSARELISEIRHCDYEGLNPQDYHLAGLEFYHEKRIRTSGESIEYEWLLTDAFLLYATHLMYGKVDPITIHPHWPFENEEIDFSNLLEKVQSTGHIADVIRKLRPQHPNYSRLMKKMKEFKELAAKGGWDSLPVGMKVRPGVMDPQIITLRKFLVQAGDLKSNAENLSFYDEELESAVKNFQKRHGLEADGKIGRETIEAMNVPVDERIKEIAINLERLRWLPRNLGNRYILVNIPAYYLQVIRDNQVDMEMPVAVGKTYRPTPVMSSAIDHLVLNPFWRVPPGILKNDLLPAQIRNNEYLKEKDIEVIDYKTGEVVDLADIEWDSISTRSFPYQLRQNPGKGNALGAIKFSFPNPFSIYLHDTNNHSIFNRHNRALSSGCIRLAQPKELAGYLLKDMEGWTSTRLDRALASKKDYAIVLEEKMPIYIQYWTAFVDEEGLLNFRPDIYEHNQALLDQFKAARELPI